jgi:hypothetical protein
MKNFKKTIIRHNKKLRKKFKKLTDKDQRRMGILRDK